MKNDYNEGNYLFSLGFSYSLKNKVILALMQINKTDFIIN